MTIRRDPSKALQLGFVALLLISMAQAVYWIRENVYFTRDVETRFESLYSDVSTAELRRLLPELAIDAATPELRVRELALEDLERGSDQRVNRYLWEGGFFLVVLFSGMLVLTRTIRHDAELRRRQQNFLAAVSHEFKSPLASVQLAAETLVLRSADADSKRLGQRILEDGERLLRMVDNLLDTTRLEEGQHALAPERVPLRASAEAGIAEVAERAHRGGIDFSVEIPESLTLSIDRGALETILRNLLDNAVKACIAGSGHSIGVRAEHSGDGVVLTVTDDGLGFAPEDAEMMFEKFYRLGDELRRTMPGTGLGLYIVRRLVEMNGARIRASSAGVGHGAAIEIVWPQKALA